MASLFKNIEKFDVLSLLEVINMYIALELNGAYYVLKRAIPEGIPAYENVIAWAGLLLDAELMSVMANHQAFAPALEQLRRSVEAAIRRKAGESQLKSRLHALEINKAISFPNVSNSDVVLETVYL